MYTWQSVHSTIVLKERQHHSQAAAHQKIGEAAMCNEKNAKYCADVRRPTRLRGT